MYVRLIRLMNCDSSPARHAMPRDKRQVGSQNMPETIAGTRVGLIYGGRADSNSDSDLTVFVDDDHRQKLA